MDLISMKEPNSIECGGTTTTPTSTTSTTTTTTITITQFREYVETKLSQEAGNLVEGGGDGQIQNLRENEKAWLDDACLSRFLRARDGNMKKAYEMLMDCLKWRRQIEIEKLILGEDNNMNQIVRKEGSSGKIITLKNGGKNGEVVILLRPGFENSNDKIGNIKYLVWSLERACCYHDEWIVIVDYEGYSLRNAPSMQVARETIRILQGCYPERLKFGILVDPPNLFWLAWKVLKHFVDPITREKIQFVSKNDLMGETGEWKERVLDVKNIPKVYGGELDWAWDSDSYFEERVIPHYLNLSQIANGLHQE